MLFTLEILIKKFKTNLEALQTHEKKNWESVLQDSTLKVLLTQADGLFLCIL
jgi:hypothetical protein